MKDKIYECCGCDHVQRKIDMKHDFGVGYDQYCCENCGEVLIDEINENVYAEELPDNYFYNDNPGRSSSDYINW